MDRNLLFAIGGLALILGLFVFAGVFSPGRTSGDRYEEGLAAWREGNHTEAVEILGEIAASRPRDPELASQLKQLRREAAEKEFLDRIDALPADDLEGRYGVLHTMSILYPEKPEYKEQASVARARFQEAQKRQEAEEARREVKAPAIRPTTQQATPGNVGALVGQRVTVTLFGTRVTGRVLSAPRWDAPRGDYLFDFQRDDMGSPGRLRLGDIGSIKKVGG